VIAYPVRVGIIVGILASMSPSILAYSSCLSAKGLGLCRRAADSTVTRSRLSSLLVEVISLVVVKSDMSSVLVVRAFPDKVFRSMFAE